MIARAREHVVVSLLWLGSGIALIVISSPLPRYHATSWHYFHDAATLLFRSPAGDGAGGLDLYLAHPEFQFGPLAILVAAPFALIPRSIGVPTSAPAVVQA